ncbi:MAG: hypothetical protein IJO04_05810 [Oscillospiraceae bacterium]|nr:hypothetical protein [Oscillospiraceae bacterium]
MGIYTLQIGSFPPILRQNATAGVKPCRGVLSGLAEISFFGVLRSFEGKIFFLQEHSGDEEILDVFQERWISYGEKESFKTV